MKDNNNLEKQFRDGLKDHEAGPPDGAKSTIEKNLVDAGLLKDKNESRGGLWIVMLLVLLAAAPVILLLKKNNKQAQQSAVQATEKNSVGTAKNSITRNEETQITNQENGKVKEIVKENNGTTTISGEGRAISKHKRSNNGEKNSRAKRQHLASTTTSLALNVKANKNEQTEERNDSTVFSSENKKEKPSIPTLADNGSLNDDDGAIAKNTNPEDLAEQKDTLAAKKAKALADTAAHPRLPSEKALPQIAFDFSGAPQFNSFKYGNGAITDNETYIEQSRRSEKPTPSFSAAFGIVLTMRHIIIETGLRHSSLSSDFSYSETYYTIDTSANPHDTIAQQTHYIATNKISFIEFPLLAGYEFHAAKFAIEVKSGVMIGYITSANTTTFSLTSGDVVQYNELANSPYSKINWSYLGAAQALYPLGGRFSIFIQPAFKLGLNSLFKDNYSVTKKIQSTSVGVGLRVKL